MAEIKDIQLFIDGMIEGIKATEGDLSPQEVERVLNLIKDKLSTVRVNNSKSTDEILEELRKIGKNDRIVPHPVSPPFTPAPQPWFDPPPYDPNRIICGANLTNGDNNGS